MLILKRVFGGKVGTGGSLFIPGQLLAAMFKWDSEIPLSQIEGILLRATGNAEKAGTLFDAKGFLVQVQMSEQIYLRQPKKTFNVVTSLSVLVNDRWFPRFFHLRTVNNSQVTFLKKRPQDFQLSPSAFLEPGQYEKDLEGKVFVRIKTTARTHIEAVNTALWDLDLLRGIWNLFINHGSFTFSIGGLPKPCNEILRGPYITAQIIGVYQSIQDYVNTSFVPSLPLPTSLDRDPDKILDLERKTRRKVRSQPWKEKLMDWIVLYCRSLDLSDRHNSFLGLWQALEMMTITEGERHEEIPKRVSWLYNDWEFERIIVDVLREYRNEAVHRAREIPGDEYIVSELRRHVENVLRFYLFNGLKIKSLSEARDLLKTPSDLERVLSELNKYKKSSKFRSYGKTVE